MPASRRCRLTAPEAVGREQGGDRAVEPAEVFDQVEHRVAAADQAGAPVVGGEAGERDAEVGRMGGGAGGAQARAACRRRSASCAASCARKRGPAPAKRVERGALGAAPRRALGAHFDAARCGAIAAIAKRRGDFALERRRVIGVAARAAPTSAASLRQQPFVEREHRDAADADAGAVRGRLAVDREAFHFPQMRELVVAAAGRARVAVGLHREAARPAGPCSSRAERLGLARGKPLGRAQPAAQVVLHERERARR